MKCRIVPALFFSYVIFSHSIVSFFECTISFESKLKNVYGEYN